VEREISSALPGATKCTRNEKEGRRRRTKGRKLFQFPIYSGRLLLWKKGKKSSFLPQGAKN
jgi:hypothetical protein